MNRYDIRQAFRGECPEITDRVISDTTLNSWLLTGDKSVSAIARCIIGETTLTSVASSTVYTARIDLVDSITKFYDIDDYPGGGVVFDNEPLIKTSVAKLDEDTGGYWRDRSAGKPEEYYRRGKWLYFDRPVSSSYASKDIIIYSVLISDDFDDDTIMPFNNLSYLEPFHHSLVLYLKWRAKSSVGKAGEGELAKNEFMTYTNWMKSVIGGGVHAPILYRGPDK